MIADKFSFLGDGEMSELVRKFDWSKTSVGTPDTWSSPLRTTLGIVMNSQFPMLLWWGKDLVQFYNDAFRPSLGVTGRHPTSLGAKVKDSWPEAWDFIKPLADEVWNTRKSYFVENQLVSILRNGKMEDIYWTFSYSVVLDDSNEVAGILAVVNEVTPLMATVEELKESKKQLESNQARMRSLVASSPFPIAVYEGREMRIVMANQAIVDIWGKGEEWRGNTYYALLPELASQQVHLLLDSVFTTGKPFTAQNQPIDLVVNGKMTPFYFNYSFTPLFDSDGKVYGVLNTAADVTDLNIAKQRVERSEANFRNMIITAPVAMCILIGPNHVVDICNDLMMELWGKSRDTVMNKPIFDGLPDARSQGLEKLLDDVYQTGFAFKANERPVELVRKGKKETVYQNFVYEPYRDADGRILGVLAITMDVTDQVLARQKIEDIVKERTVALEVSNTDLSKSNAELAQFAYIASHDLQEPLRKIRTFAQMLEKNMTTNIDLSKGYLDKIQNASKRMESLIRDVLTYSEVTKANDLFEYVDLNSIVNDVKSDFEVAIEQKNAKLEFENLPVIEAIPLQMSQLFSNLISNALKFSKPGVDPVIKINVQKPTTESLTKSGLSTVREYFCIRVSDNGIGFEEEFADKIFHIFQRLHRKSEFEGTGIGLAICKKIVLNHEGTINAKGTSEKGAVFNIVLPARRI